METTPIDRVARPTPPQRNNMAVLISCGVFVACMVGAAYAAVPLYDLYCKATGYNGTTRQVEQASDVILKDRIRVEFDSNTASDLNWDFKPVEQFVEPRIGETMRVNFRVTNNSTREKTGRSVFNVTPMVAGAYFNKLECFCFTDVTLKPGETRDMPVVFFVDPDVVNYPETKDLKVLTLSYTFYSSQKPKPVADAKVTDESVAKKL
ncbi:MAG: Cytochrome oxidase biosis protein Cox11-CtaG, copper delivery to Cox1 [Rhizobium sp.]|nr:Cytochrome oxidase biosis protein Cox11-CtaG, copper delivery to Cox1 [Rhizobium sp.]